MKIEQSTVVRLKITDIERLDPITVFLEDFEPRKGKITIECYGQSWSSYWGGMGDSSIAEFFIDCNNHYLAKNLSRIRSDVDDYEAFHDVIKLAIIKARRKKHLDRYKARELYDSAVDDIGYFNDDDGLSWCKSNSDYLYNVLGEDWWFDIPKKPNHEYQYLCRIIDAVRDGLVEYLKSVEEVEA